MRTVRSERSEQSEHSEQSEQSERYRQIKEMRVAFETLDLENARSLLLEMKLKDDDIERKKLHHIFRTCNTPEQREFIWSLRDMINLTSFPSLLSLLEMYELSLLHPEFRQEFEEHVKLRLVGSYTREKAIVKMAKNGMSKLLMDAAHAGAPSSHMSAASAIGVACLTIRLAASLPGAKLEDILPLNRVPTRDCYYPSILTNEFWAEALIGAVLGGNEEIVERAKEELKMELDKFAA